MTKPEIVTQELWDTLTDEQKVFAINHEAEHAKWSKYITKTTEEIYQDILNYKQPEPAPVSREEALEEACQALELTHHYSCYAYVTRRVEIDDICDIEASSIEAAAGKAYDHFWNEYSQQDDDHEEFPNVSIYVNNTSDFRDYGDKDFVEFIIDARRPGETWSLTAARIVSELAVAETDEARQRLVREAREALHVDHTPERV